MTVTEIARELGIHPQTVRRWVERGEVPGIRWGKGDKLWIKRSDLVSYLASRHTRGPTMPTKLPGKRRSG